MRTPVSSLNEYFRSSKSKNSGPPFFEALLSDTSGSLVSSVSSASFVSSVSTSVAEGFVSFVVSLVSSVSFTAHITQTQRV